MKKLFIVDASGYIYRSYFAIRNMTNAKGESTNALFGFIRSVQKLIKDFTPDHLIAVFDGPRNAASREKIYPDYKGHRASMPPDLGYQIPWARDYCAAAGIPLLNIAEVEADDTMASIAKWAAKRGAEVFVCTSDKDMCQIVNDQVKLLNTFKENKIIGPLEVKEEWGVPPEKMIDFLAITGDSSDNIPGLSGFGPKTAAELLNSLGTLDAILEDPTKISGKKKQETVVKEKDMALLSRILVTVDTQVEIPHEEQFYALKPPHIDTLKELFSRMNFASLLKELDKAHEQGNRRDIQEQYHLVDSPEAFSKLMDKLHSAKEVCFDTETTALQPLLAELVGIGFCIEEGESWYVPLNGKLSRSTVIEGLKNLFSLPEIGFFGHNVKYDYHILRNCGIDIAHISFDTILASYLLNSHSRQHSLDHLSLELFGKVKIPIEDLIGKGKNAITMAEVPLDKICAYCCEDADYTFRLKKILSAQLNERGLSSLLYDIELPLLKVLAEMERHGIFIDVPLLKKVGIDIQKHITTLEERIYQLAGEPFNLNSPKQLSHILFEKMGISPPKKTATGHSTNAEVLEVLSTSYPIASEILEYRTLEKLRSTYIESLPDDVNPRTHRIHCTFNQSVAATGRLSCQDPNLQNIPIRTENGRKIREAFKPQLPGWSYLSADYSQIELRLLAHFSEDPTLIDAFHHNEDIHALTASTIYGIPPSEVTKEQRQKAKAVNFGVVYGQQSYGLSQTLRIDVKEAQTLINVFYARFPKVKGYLESCKEKARLSGKAVTLSGRERLIPEINSKNGTLRAAAERLAINTPLQGSQADIIKMAMRNIDARIKKERLVGYMILQIHDELIFEIPDEEIPGWTLLIQEEMPGVLQLKIPLAVEIALGKNWKEC